MTWQQINYFAVADVVLWGVKISLPGFWEKHQSNHFISSLCAYPCSQIWLRSSTTNGHNNHKQYSIKFPNGYFNMKDIKPQPFSTIV